VKCVVPRLRGDDGAVVIIRGVCRGTGLQRMGVCRNREEHCGMLKGWIWATGTYVCAWWVVV